nr:VP1 [Phasianus chaphamaparvovirus]
MSETFVFKNVYMTYIDNEAYEYPSVNQANLVQSTTAPNEAIIINTGWHVIPNILWRHCCTPKQWFKLITNCEAYTVKSISGIMYNPIPITTNISLQRVSQFSAFNNCTYAMTYDDNKYETQWMQWNDLPLEKKLCLAQKEGLVWTGQQGHSSGNYHASRYQWPLYQWRLPNMRTVFDGTWSQGKGSGKGVYDTGASIPTATSWQQSIPGGIFWDPLNCADEIGELRAGKNSISFSWNVAPCDQNKWFNLDILAAYAEWSPDGPYAGVGRPWTLKKTFDMDPAIAATFGQAKASSTTTGDLADFDDYSVPNFFNLPVVPVKWFWIEIGRSVADWTGENSTYNKSEPFWKKIDKNWPGTEYESYAYPPCQWFCKGIPLYAVDNNPIKTSTQVSFEITLTLEGKKRRSAYFAPTHGPWSGDQLYYHGNDKGIFQPAAIRYRTGGRRRTWQNMCTRWKESMNADQKKHNLMTNPRKDNYIWNVTDQNAIEYNNKHAPVGVNDYSGANASSLSVDDLSRIRVTWNKATDSTEIIMEEPETEPTEVETGERTRKHKLPSNLAKLMHLN